MCTPRRHGSFRLVTNSRVLWDGTWSTVEILADLLQVSRQAGWKTLKQLETAGLVRQHKIILVGRSALPLWGITPHGLAYAWDLEEPVENRPTFEPSRIALSMVPHNLALQHTRLRGERAGWTESTRGERLGFNVKYRPDAIYADESTKTCMRNWFHLNIIYFSFRFSQ